MAPLAAQDALLKADRQYCNRDSFSPADPKQTFGIAASAGIPVW
jgi:hypothetical protein